MPAPAYFRARFKLPDGKLTTVHEVSHSNGRDPEDLIRRQALAGFPRGTEIVEFARIDAPTTPEPAAAGPAVAGRLGEPVAPPPASRSGTDGDDAPGDAAAPTDPS
jgi:hypothetical protein